MNERCCCWRFEGSLPVESRGEDRREDGGIGEKEDGIVTDRDADAAEIWPARTEPGLGLVDTGPGAAAEGPQAAVARPLWLPETGGKWRATATELRGRPAMQTRRSDALQGDSGRRDAAMRRRW